jgi:hypothetical protein
MGSENRASVTVVDPGPAEGNGADTFGRFRNVIGAKKFRIKEAALSRGIM